MHVTPDYGAFLGIIIAGAIYLIALFVMNRKKSDE